MNNGKYQQWLEPEKLILVKGWAMDGLSDKEIAHNIGIGLTALYDWKKRFPKFANVLKVSKGVADNIVQNALFEAARSGNVTAMIFWLKNRKPAQWRDRPAAVESMDIEDMKPLADLLGEPIE